MSRPKTLHVGAGVVTRYRNGVCAFACNRSDCHAYSEPRGWRAAMRQARQHAVDHDATEARYVGTPWGVPAHELPRPTRRLSGPLGRLAIVVLVLTLTTLVLTLTRQRDRPRRPGARSTGYHGGAHHRARARGQCAHPGRPAGHRPERPMAPRA
jgi:hypothetical protein